jgi:hypothetical protein
MIASVHAPFGGRCENTMRPSDVHEGQRSSPAWDVNRRAAPPAAGAIHTSNDPLVLAAKAIDFPSGDHAGSRSAAHPCAAGTTRFGSFPSGVIVQIASNQVVANRLPSGDHAASRTPVVTAAGFLRRSRQMRSRPGHERGGHECGDRQASHQHQRTTTASSSHNSDL